MVIVANLLKVIAIFPTLRTCSSDHIMTVGDAVSTFLEHPEKRSRGKCTLSTMSHWTHVKPWAYHEMPIVWLLGGRRLGTITVL